MSATEGGAALPPFGWLVLRHVARPSDGLLWLECCRRLRRWFAADPIVIVDNLSNRSLYRTPNVFLLKCCVGR